MPGKGEPGWVLRELGRHPRPGDLSGSQTMLRIGVGFTIGHGLIHTLRMGAVCLTQPGSLDVSVSSLRQDQARGKLKGVQLLWWAGDSPAPLLWTSAPGPSSEACTHTSHMLPCYGQEYPQGQVRIQPPPAQELCMPSALFPNRHASLPCAYGLLLALFGHLSPFWGLWINLVLYEQHILASVLSKLTILFLASLMLHTCVPSHVRLFATPQTVAHQAPLSMGFSRQDWSGLAFPPAGDLPNASMEHVCHISCTGQAGSFLVLQLGKSTLWPYTTLKTRDWNWILQAYPIIQRTANFFY